MLDHFKKKTFFFIFILLTTYTFLSQAGTITGKVIDTKDLEPLIGVNVFNQNNIGSVTNINGDYKIKFPVGKHKVTFQYIGYQKTVKEIILKENDSVVINISLNSINNELNEMVVSANKYEEKLGDVPVSMSIIKPSLIENKATRDAESIIEQVPGVQINENQASIRGGSGWSYGAGSRVLVMVDGMPMLGGDANDIKWTAIPLENISQVEI